MSASDNTPSHPRGENLDHVAVEEWTEYHEFRKRTDPPPYGLGLDDA
jgi:hypothetical protein